MGTTNGIYPLKESSFVGKMEFYFHTVRKYRGISRPVSQSRTMMENANPIFLCSFLVGEPIIT